MTFSKIAKLCCPYSDSSCSTLDFVVFSEGSVSFVRVVSIRSPCRLIRRRLVLKSSRIVFSEHSLSDRCVGESELRVARVGRACGLATLLSTIARNNQPLCTLSTLFSLSFNPLTRKQKWIYL